jgi:regulatory protein
VTAKNVALRLLGVKSRTVLELRKKLLERGFPEEEVEAALSFCRECGYLNDEEELRRRQASLKRRGYGPRYITAKLKMQGLHSAPISREEQLAAISSLLQKPAWQRKAKPNLIAALQRRGFDYELILSVLEH